MALLSASLPVQMVSAYRETYSTDADLPYLKAQTEAGEQGKADDGTEALHAYMELISF